MKTLLLTLLTAVILSCDGDDPEPVLVRCDIKTDKAVGVVCNDGFRWEHGNSSRTCQGHDGVDYYLCVQ